MRSPALVVSVLLLVCLLASPDRLKPQATTAGEYGSDRLRTCEELRSLTGYEFSIAVATTVAATEAIPEHCWVWGQILPQVGFEIRLPTEWNGRFVMVGNGGYAGTISLAAQAQGLREGFATAGTDTGHSSATEPLGSFAVDRQKYIDYAYRSVHVTALTAETVMEAYYGRPPEFSYFSGCSTGGRQALISAQRFPEDFDGIIAGAPVLDFVGTMLSYVWIAKGLAPTPPDLSLLAQRVYEVCDAKDGVADGLIDDPRLCDFDPARDLPLCSEEGSPDPCYTGAQIEAFRKVYSDVEGAGERLFPGFPPGAEVFVETSRGPVSGWDRWIVSPQPDQPTVGVTFAETFLRYMAFPVPDPEYDWRSFDFQEDPGRMTLPRSALDATDRDLTAFRERGGKLLMYFGWADSALNPLMGVEYYESVLREMGSSVGDFFRLFMVPGMFHCGGGVGVNSVDWFTPLVSWVEEDTPPTRIVGSRTVDGETARTRPLCPYPEVATYRGAGSIDEASSFVCRAPGG